MSTRAMISPQSPKQQKASFLLEAIRQDDCLEQTSTQNTGPFAVSWGVECEFILAFHRDRLRQILTHFDNAHRPSVVSDDDDIDHETLLRNAKDDIGSSQAWDTRERWPTSLLAVHDADTPMTVKHYGSDELAAQWYYYETFDSEIRSRYHGKKYHRTFALEPMLIAQDVLRQSNLSVRPVGMTVLPSEVRHGLLVNSNRDIDTRMVLYPGLLEPHVTLPEDQLLYDTWIMTRDMSVPPAERNEVQKKFVLSDAETGRWDSDAIELVSPKFDRNEFHEAFGELKDIFHALRYHKYERDSINLESMKRSLQGQNEDRSEKTHGFRGGYGTLESVFAGTHVHIGLNLENQSISPLSILKHLAFIVLANEDLISTLHPYRRRGWPVKQVSPLSEVFPINKGRSSSKQKRYRITKEETRMSELTEKYITAYSLHSNRQWFMRSAYKSPPSTPGNPSPTRDEQYHQLADRLLDPDSSSEAFFASIQETTYEDDGTINRHHGSIVDFSRIARNIGLETSHNRMPPCTVEFRQHGCTLDADEIKHWVKFLFALVDLAQRRAYQKTDFEGRSLAVAAHEKEKYGEPIQSVEELCGPYNLNLPPEEIEYWKSRAQRYASEEQTWNLKAVSRRRKRAVDKARHGRLLRNEDFVAMASLLSPRRSYRNMSRADLLEQLQGKLNLEAGYDPDQHQLNVLAGKSRLELSELLMKMDTNLLETGFYVNLSDVDWDDLPNLD